MSLVGLIAQFGMWFYWGGRLEGRVASLEVRQDKTEQVTQTAVIRDGEHDVKIAVTISQQAEIIARLQRIETKVEARR